jgi:hypothetical protein
MSTIPPNGAEVESKPWQTGIAPVYIGTYLWIAFFDQIGRRALPMGGLGWSMLGALAAGPLAYLLMFRPAGNWGQKVGKPLNVVSTATFGIAGSKLVPGLLLGIAQVLLYAVAVGYAIELSFQGLVMLGFVDPASMRPIKTGGATLKAPIYLATALVWSVVAALISLRFTRWIAYLMQFFPIFPAILIGGAMLAMLTGLRSFLPTGIDPAFPRLPLTPSEGAIRAFLLTFQWVFAFSAMGAVLAADWGSASPGPRDVSAGGWVGMGLAPAIIAALALISVAGYQGSKMAGSSLEEGRFAQSTIEMAASPGSTGPAPGLDAPPYTFRAVANGGFGRWVGGVMLMVFGLASLAPAVYASFSFGLQFQALGPGVARLYWTLLGVLAAWMLIVGGWFDRTEQVFALLGAAFAPAAGAIAADFRRHQGNWPGPREGINPAGLFAWAIGFAVGIAPTVARSLGWDRLVGLQPAALGAFVAAYVAYEILALCRLESGPSPHGWAVSE